VADADDLLTLLPAGRRSAIPARVLASYLGVTTRTVAQLVNELVERGVLVGSSCGSRSGYFLIVSIEDLERGIAHIRARALASLHRWSVVRTAALEHFRERQGDVLTLFDLSEVGP
jgi:hypothetical protein